MAVDCLLEIQLPGVFRLEPTRLQLDNHITPQIKVIEQQVDVEIIPTDIDVVLIFDPLNFFCSGGLTSLTKYISQKNCTALRDSKRQGALTPFRLGTPAPRSLPVP